MSLGEEAGVCSPREATRGSSWKPSNICRMQAINFAISVCVCAQEQARVMLESGRSKNEVLQMIAACLKVECFMKSCR